MASIGATALDAWRGTIQRPRRPVAVHTRTGVAGAGFTVGAAVGVPSDVQTEKLLATLSAAMTQVSAFEALVGTVISVTDSAGIVHASTLVLGCSNTVRSVAGVVGLTALVETQWQFMVEA
jgi:hypothetical protein